MTAEQIIGVVVQYGLPTVLLAATWYVYLGEKKAWDAERKELYEKVIAEGKERVEDAREYTSAMKDTIAATDKARSNSDRILDEFGKFRDDFREQREKDRDRDNERDQRLEKLVTSTGSHQPIEPMKRPR